MRCGCAGTAAFPVVGVLLLATAACGPVSQVDAVDEPSGAQGPSQSPPSPGPVLPSPSSSSPSSLSTCGPSEAQVAWVFDGDTVMLQDKTRVRYLGVDSPELGRGAEALDACFAREAWLANRRWVQGQTVHLEYDARCRDDYGRLLAYVYLPTRASWRGHGSINHALLERGFGRSLSLAPNTRYADAFRRAAQHARDAGAGLWSDCR